MMGRGFSFIFSFISIPIIVSYLFFGCSLLDDFRNGYIIFLSNKYSEDEVDGGRYTHEVDSFFGLNQSLILN